MAREVKKKISSDEIGVETYTGSKIYRKVDLDENREGRKKSCCWYYNIVYLFLIIYWNTHEFTYDQSHQTGGFLCNRTQ